MVDLSTDETLCFRTNLNLTGYTRCTKNQKTGEYKMLKKSKICGNKKSITYGIGDVTVSVELRIFSDRLILNVSVDTVSNDTENDKYRAAEFEDFTLDYFIYPLLTSKYVATPKKFYLSDTFYGKDVNSDNINCSIKTHVTELVRIVNEARGKRDARLARLNSFGEDIDFG